MLSKTRNPLPTASPLQDKTAMTHRTEPALFTNTSTSAEPMDGLSNISSPPERSPLRHRHVYSQHRTGKSSVGLFPKGTPPPPLTLARLRRQAQKPLLSISRREEIQGGREESQDEDPPMSSLQRDCALRSGSLGIQGRSAGSARASDLGATESSQIVTTSNNFDDDEDGAENQDTHGDLGPIYLYHPYELPSSIPDHHRDLSQSVDVIAPVNTQPLPSTSLNPLSHHQLQAALYNRSLARLGEKFPCYASSPLGRNVSDWWSEDSPHGGS
ncbi:hypothetical protein JB92DRAFT_2977335 [Gautieria morchelliformis]|nr:hypothetical protein JB92DRAFT_2977335 [Gautieria morchelliformis]